MKSRELDQFYTNTDVALKTFEKTKSFINDLDVEFDYWLEPSAGNGSFYALLPEKNRVGVDIDPKIEGIVESNFFDFDLGDDIYFTIGNPHLEKFKSSC